MALSREHLESLYTIAKQYWLDAQAALHAYDRDFRQVKLASEWLKRGTIGLAAITAVTSAFPSVPWLTALAGIGTAIIATYDQIYAPTKSIQSFWDCRTQLESLKKDLVTCATTIDESTDIRDGAKPFQQIGSLLPEIMNIPTEITEHDRELALSRFDGTVIHTLLERLVSGPDNGLGPGEMPDQGGGGLPDDAPDIVPTVRRRVSG